MWSFRIMFFLLCINVVSYVVLNVQTNNEYLFPGVTYTHPLNSTGGTDEYEENFNATGTVEQWQPQGGYGFAGDLFSALSMFWTSIRFLVDGFGTTMDWIATMIPVAQTTFTWVAWIFRILFGVVTLVFVVQMISGRDIES